MGTGQNSFRAVTLSLLCIFLLILCIMPTMKKPQEKEAPKEEASHLENSTGYTTEKPENSDEAPIKLTEAIMLDWDDKPWFREEAIDKWGNVYTDVFLFCSQEYEYGFTAATFSTEEADQLICTISPHQSIFVDERDGYGRFNLLIYVDDELIYESPEIWDTTEPFEQVIDVSGSKTIRLSLKQGNGTNVVMSGPMGSIIVDGTLINTPN